MFLTKILCRIFSQYLPFALLLLWLAFPLKAHEPPRPKPAAFSQLVLVEKEPPRARPKPHRHGKFDARKIFLAGKKKVARAEKRYRKAQHKPNAVSERNSAGLFGPYLQRASAHSNWGRGLWYFFLYFFLFWLVAQIIFGGIYAFFVLIGQWPFSWGLFFLIGGAGAVFAGILVLLFLYLVLKGFSE